MTEIIKVCVKHGELTIDKVNINGFYYGKQRYKCKACQKEIARRYYEKNKEQVLAKCYAKRDQRKEWREKNKEHIRQWRREYAAKKRAAKNKIETGKVKKVKYEYTQGLYIFNEKTGLYSLNDEQKKARRKLLRLIHTIEDMKDGKTDKDLQASRAD